MKSILIPAFLSLAAVFNSLPLLSQNIQFHYDFGKALYTSGAGSQEHRPQLTTTVEMFRPDTWGSTFFFIDMNYGSAGKDGGVLGAYWEIARELRFWKAPVSVHIEYNGGIDAFSGSYDDAWLAGPSWSAASRDFSRTFSLSVMYKAIPRNVKCVSNFQVTAVWNLYFLRRMFLFCGFMDFWKENRPWQVTRWSGADGTDFILLTEPQLWYNFNSIKGMEKFNLSIGTEVELSNNFVAAGFFAIPTAAVKWTF